ncbi:MAG: hypothetical protein PHE08_09735, partial [Bacteroidales bacterium]|nr:hypothetical protein [Bacteroidales bacterium]
IHPTIHINNAKLVEMLMHRVATVDNPTRAGIILCPVGRITAFSPGVESVAFCNCSGFVGKGNQVSLVVE